jgi:hypothetical protein
MISLKDNVLNSLKREKYGSRAALMRLQLFVVREANGSIGVCIDYRAINERTVKVSFPLPHIDDLINQLKDATCITHFDLRSAYNQVIMSDDGPSDDSYAATFFQGLTPNGFPCLLEMLVMGFFGLLFGLFTAPKALRVLRRMYWTRLYIGLLLIIWTTYVFILNRQKNILFIFGKS